LVGTLGALLSPLVYSGISCTDPSLNSFTATIINVRNATKNLFKE